MRTMPIVLAILFAVVAAVAILKARLALVCVVATYVAVGLVEEVIFFKKRRLAEQEQTHAAEPSSSAP
jgi:hypothetical protein